MNWVVALAVAVIVMVVPVAADSVQLGDPVSYHLVVEMLDSDGVSHVEKPYDAAYTNLVDAFAQAERLHKSGYCFQTADPPIPDPLLVALCYPPGRILRIRVLRY